MMIKNMFRVWRHLKWKKKAIQPKVWRWRMTSAWHSETTAVKRRFIDVDVPCSPLINSQKFTQFFLFLSFATIEQFHNYTFASSKGDDWMPMEFRIPGKREYVQSGCVSRLVEQEMVVPWSPFQPRLLLHQLFGCCTRVCIETRPLLLESESDRVAMAHGKLHTWWFRCVVSTTNHCAICVRYPFECPIDFSSFLFVPCSAMKCESIY